MTKPPQDGIVAEEVLKAKMMGLIKEAVGMPQVQQQLPSLLAEARNLYNSYLCRTTSGLSDGRDLWTVKYAPTCLPEVACRLPAALTVQQWLQGWKARQAEAKDAAAPADPPAGRPKGGRGKPTTPTGQESLDLSKTAASIFFPLASTAPADLTDYSALLLHGPSGSGKTSSVYMCCQALGYRVIEVNPSVRRTGKAVLHLFKEATQSYSLIMRDPVTSGDIWKTLPDCPPEPAAKRLLDPGPEPVSTGKRTKREAKAQAPSQESLPVLPKPSRNLISFFGQKPELSADAGDGGAAAVAAASNGAAGPAPRPKQNGALKAVERGSQPSSGGQGKTAADFFRPKGPTARLADPEPCEAPKRPRVEEKETSVPIGPPQPNGVTKQENGAVTAPRPHAEVAPDPAPRGRAKRLKAEAEPAEECPAAQWCDFGAWAEKTDPGIQENTVILFDDADVVFPDEQGFLAALKQLIDDNKCPVIVTCTQPIAELAADDNVLQVAFDIFAPSPPVTIPSAPTIHWAGGSPTADGAPVNPPVATLPDASQAPRRLSKRGSAANPIDVSTPEKPPPGPSADPTAPASCPYLFGAPLHLQLLLANHGCDLDLLEAEAVLRYHHFDWRQVLLALQLWTRHPTLLPNTSATDPHALRPANGVVSDLLGLQAWLRWWRTLAADAAHAPGQLPPQPPACKPRGLGRFRDPEVDRLAQALGQRPHGTARHSGDLLFHNYPALLPARLHAFFASLPPGPYPVAPAAEHSAAPPPEDTLAAPASPAAEESAAPAAEPVGVEPGGAAMGGVLDSSDSRGSTSSGDSSPLPQTEGLAPPEEAEEELPPGAPVDVLIRRVAARQRREAEARARARKAAFWGPRSPPKAAAAEPEGSAPIATAAAVQESAAEAGLPEAEPAAPPAPAEGGGGRPRRDRRHPDRFTVPLTRSRSPKAVRPAPTPTGAMPAPPRIDPNHARLACDVLESIAEVAASLSTCDVLFRGVAHPRRMVNTPAFWGSDCRTSLLEDPEDTSFVAEDHWVCDLEHGFGVSYPFPFLAAEVAVGKRALQRALRRLGASGGELPHAGPCPGVDGDPPPPLNAALRPPSADIDDDPSRSVSSSSASSLAAAGSDKVVDGPPGANSDPARPPLPGPATSGRPPPTPGTLSFARCRAKLGCLVPGGGGGQPGATNWDDVAVVWEADVGLVPLIPAAPGVAVAHCRPWLVPTTATAQAAALKGAVPDLLPYWTWDTGRLCSEVVPFMAAICGLEEQRERRGRRKSKFRHHFDHLAEDARRQLLAYRYAAPTHTASGHRLP
eukprot:EG_transcript_607